MQFPFNNSLLTANLHTGWASILFETLRCLGVQAVVISSGSRCVPLIIGATQNPYLECISISDERSAAFFALGLAQRKGAPVALVCTSGSAPAHHYPAVIEAAEHNIPLIVLTADRFPPHRGCSARQTVDQEHLFGHYPRFYKDMGMPQHTDFHWRYLRQTAMQAFTHALQPVPGPVHLNLPFEEPLAPTADPSFQEWMEAHDWEAFFAHVLPLPSLQLTLKHLPDKILKDLNPTKKGLIIVGPHLVTDEKTFLDSIHSISQKLGWPVLAEGFCPTRHHLSAVPHLITYYALIVSCPTLLKALTPEVILHVGPLPTDKGLNAWLQSLPAPVYFVSPHYKNLDALHRSTLHLNLSLHNFDLLLPSSLFHSNRDYLKEWQAAEQAAASFLTTYFKSVETIFEPKVAWLLAEHLPAGTPIFVGSSTPLRDVEGFWQPSNKGFKLYGRRGTNGIDGAIASGLGVAYDHQPTVVLVGDLALIHDLSSLLIQQEFKGHLSIVVINNAGGGIFESLPIAAYEHPFERFVAASHSLRFQKLAEAYNIEYLQPTDWESFTALLHTLPSSGIRLIEIISNRKQDAELRKDLKKAFQAVVTLQ